MGMWDRDKLYGGVRLDRWAEYCPTDAEGRPIADQIDGHAFIVWEAEVMPTLVETKVGKARKSRLVVSPLDAPDNRCEVGTLASAIAEKVSGEAIDRDSGELVRIGAGAEPADFPAVVIMLQVPSAEWGTTATVLQFVRPYDGATVAGKAAKA